MNHSSHARHDRVASRTETPALGESAVNPRDRWYCHEHRGLNEKMEMFSDEVKYSLDKELLDTLSRVFTIPVKPRTPKFSASSGTSRLRQFLFAIHTDALIY